MRSSWRGEVMFALVGLLVLSAACSSVASRRAQHVQEGVAAAVEQIQLGMSQAEVLSVMGEPHLKRSVRLLKENLRYEIRISITFVQGQVVHVSMI